MKTPLQITFHGLAHSPELEAAIREKAAKLERTHSRLTSCRVVVELPAKHQHKGKEFTVRIDLAAPDCEIAVTKDHNDDPYVALHEAFDAADRQLESQQHRHDRA